MLTKALPLIIFLGEEIAIIFKLSDHDHHGEHQSGTDTMAQKLVAHANSVIHQAEEILKDGTIRLREAREMTHEIEEIKKLIKAIEAHPNAAELKAEATQLAKHEETLRTLVERAKHSHHSNTKMPPINSPFL